MLKEYPKFLTMRGEWEGESVTVQSAEEEAGKRAEGFRMIGEPQKENESVKRTRKAKE